MRVYFEHIRWFHRGIIKYYLKREYEIYAFDMKYSVTSRPWVQNLIVDQKITPIFYHAHDPGFGEAIDLVEETFKGKREGLLIKSIRRLIGDEDITSAYKKAKAREFSEFFFVRNYFKKKLTNGQRTSIFYPDKYHLIITRLKSIGITFSDIPGLKVSRIWSFLATLTAIFSRLKSALKFFLYSCVTLFIFLIGTFFRQKDKPLHYRYAIPITQPEFQLRYTGNRRFDFLLDGKDITKNNTVFLLFRPLNSENTAGIDSASEISMSINHKNVNNILSGEYQIYNAYNTKRFNSIRQIIKSGKRPSDGLLLVISAIVALLFDDETSIIVSSTLLKNIIRWRIILSDISFDNYIYFNEESYTQNIINSLIRRSGGKTWYYAHSWGFGYVFTVPYKVEMLDLRYVAWSYLNPNHLIIWNEDMEKYFRLHKQEVSAYHNVGSFWSELIKPHMKKKGVSVLRGIVNEKDISDQMKIVAFFDTSYINDPHYLYNINSAIAFYSAIKRFLKEDGNIFAIIKPSKKIETYTSRHSIWYSHDAKRLKEIWEELSDHPRCWFSEDSSDTPMIQGISDLVVTHAFSSPTIEAIGARKRALFFDPSDKLRGVYADLVPGFVTHGYDELKNRIDELLYKTTDQQYNHYLETHIKPKIDNYIDGFAITRFRKLLSSS